MKKIYLILVALIVTSVGCGKPPQSRTDADQVQEDPDEGHINIPHREDGGNGCTTDCPPDPKEKMKNECKKDPFSHLSSTDENDNCFCLLKGGNDTGCLCTIDRWKSSAQGLDCSGYKTENKDKESGLCVKAKITQSEKDQNDCFCAKPENEKSPKCSKIKEAKELCDTMCSASSEHTYSYWSKFVKDHKQFGDVDCDNDGLTNKEELSVDKDLETGSCSTRGNISICKGGFKYDSNIKCDASASPTKYTGGTVKLTGLNPCDSDTDGDGLSDGSEYNGYTVNGSAGQNKTDPLNWDSDGDCLSDSEELNKYHFDPMKKDSVIPGTIDSKVWAVDFCKTQINNLNSEKPLVVAYEKTDGTKKVGMQVYLPANVVVDMPDGSSITSEGRGNYVPLDKKFITDGNVLGKNHGIPLEFNSQLFGGVIYYEQIDHTDNPESASASITEKLKNIKYRKFFSEYLGNGILTHDKYNAVVNEYTVTLNQDETISNVRNDIYKLLTGYNLPAKSGTEAGKAVKDFTIRLSIIQRKEVGGKTPFIVSFAVFPKITDKNQGKFEQSDIRAKDLTNTTIIANLDSKIQTTCLYARTPKETPEVYFYFVLDESASMNDINGKVKDAMNFFLTRISRASIDYKIGISPICPYVAVDRINVCANAGIPTCGQMDQFANNAGTPYRSDTILHQWDGSSHITRVDGVVTMSGWTDDSQKLTGDIDHIISNRKGDGEQGLYMAVNGIPAMLEKLGKGDSKRKELTINLSKDQIGASHTNAKVKIDNSGNSETKVMAIIVSDEPDYYFDGNGQGSKFLSKAQKILMDNDVTLFSITSDNDDSIKAYRNTAKVTKGLDIRFKNDQNPNDINDGLEKIIDRATGLASPNKIVGYQPISSSFRLYMNEFTNNIKKCVDDKKKSGKCTSDSECKDECNKEYPSAQDRITIKNNHKLVDRSIYSGYDFNTERNALQFYGDYKIPSGVQVELVYVFSYFQDNLKGK